MLQKFIVDVSGDVTAIYSFQLALERLKQNKKLYKNNFNYFKGMRENWLPLVLLEDLKTLAVTNSELKVRREEVFNVLMGYSCFQSYYIDGYVKKGNTIRMRVRGRDVENLEKMLRLIISTYNVSCNYRVIS